MRAVRRPCLALYATTPTCVLTDPPATSPHGCHGKHRAGVGSLGPMTNSRLIGIVFGFPDYDIASASVYRWKSSETNFLPRRLSSTGSVVFVGSLTSWGGGVSVGRGHSHRLRCWNGTWAMLSPQGLRLEQGLLWAVGAASLLVEDTTWTPFRGTNWDCLEIDFRGG